MPRPATEQDGLNPAIVRIVLPAEAGAEGWVEALRAADHHAPGGEARQRVTAFAHSRLRDL